MHWISSSATPRTKGAVALVVVLALVLAMVPASAFGGWWRLDWRLVSQNAQGNPGESWSYEPCISDDGQMVAFTSDAQLSEVDTIPASASGSSDVYVRDMTTPSCEQVAVVPEGAEYAERGARSASISDDGQLIALFTGRDLLPSDTNGGPDLYVKDLGTGEYTMATLGAGGDSPGDSIEEITMSGNGQFVAFESRSQILGLPDEGSSRKDVFLWDMASDETTLVSSDPITALLTDYGARLAGISDDGRYVGVFTRNDFLPSDTNDDQDLYIRDMQTGIYTLVDLTGDGTSPGSDSDFQACLSGNGEFVVFETDTDIDVNDVDSNMDVYVHEVATGDTTWVTEPPAEAVETGRGSRSATISDDGRYVAFFTGKDFDAADTNGEQDAYVCDMATGKFKLVPLVWDADPGRGVWDMVISGDGAWLAYEYSPQNFFMGTAAKESAATGDVTPQVLPIYGQVYVANLMTDPEPGGVRLDGATRYETAVAVSEDTFPIGADTIVIATGANWPDALCASALAGAVGGPVLLTQRDSLPGSVVEEIERLGASDAYIIGGTASVSDAVEAELNDMLPGYVNRLAGSDRYATSRAVANTVIGILDYSYSGKALVSTGRNYPDAVAAAPIASGLDMPILLARASDGSVDVPADTTEVVLLGGPVAVSEATEDALKADLGDANVSRLGGSTRFETAAKIAQYGVDGGLQWNGVGIASGNGYADALAGGTAVGLQRSVMLLTPTASLDPFAEAALEANQADIEGVLFFGGTAAVSNAAQAAVLAVLGM